MALIDGRLTMPFSFEDVKICLGENTEDLGKLCCSSNIAFWAKCKPVRSSQLEPLSNNQRRSLAYGIVDNYNYLLNQPTTVPNAFSDAISGDYSWIYLQPRGEDYKEWYRHVDFDGYYHYSECPFSVEPQDLTRGKLDVEMMMLDNLDEGNITLDDLTEISGNGLVTKTQNTCFGIIYSKDGEDAPILLGGNGEYPAYNEDGYPMTHILSVEVENGVYKVVPVLLNTEVGLLATIPMQYKTMTVSSENKTGDIDIYGEWYVRSDNAAIILNGQVCSDVSLAAGYLSVFVCPIGTDKTEIDTAALITEAYSYNAMAAGGCSVFANNAVISKMGVDYNQVELWARVTTPAGVAIVQLDMVENDSQIQ